MEFNTGPYVMSCFRALFRDRDMTKSVEGEYRVYQETGNYWALALGGNVCRYETDGRCKSPIPVELADWSYTGCHLMDMGEEYLAFGVKRLNYGIYEFITRFGGPSVAVLSLVHPSEIEYVHEAVVNDLVEALMPQGPSPARDAESECVSVLLSKSEGCGIALTVGGGIPVPAVDDLRFVKSARYNSEWDSLSCSCSRATIFQDRNSLTLGELNPFEVPPSSFVFVRPGPGLPYYPIIYEARNGMTIAPRADTTVWEVYGMDRKTEYGPYGTQMSQPPPDLPNIPLQCAPHFLMSLGLPKGSGRGASAATLRSGILADLPRFVEVSALTEDPLKTRTFGVPLLADRPASDVVLALQRGLEMAVKGEGPQALALYRDSPCTPDTVIITPLSSVTVLDGGPITGTPTAHVRNGISNPCGFLSCHGPTRVDILGYHAYSVATSSPRLQLPTIRPAKPNGVVDPLLVDPAVRPRLLIQNQIVCTGVEMGLYNAYGVSSLDIWQASQRVSVRVRTPLVGGGTVPDRVYGLFSRRVDPRGGGGPIRTGSRLSRSTNVVVAALTDMSSGSAPPLRVIAVLSDNRDRYDVLMAMDKDARREALRGDPTTYTLKQMAGLVGLTPATASGCYYMAGFDKVVHKDGVRFVSAE